MPPSDLTPSQALDVLESEEVIPDTEMSATGHVVASECSDNDNSVDDDTSRKRIQITQQQNRACKLFTIRLYATLCFNYFR